MSLLIFKKNWGKFSEKKRITKDKTTDKSTGNNKRIEQKIVTQWLQSNVKKYLKQK